MSKTKKMMAGVLATAAMVSLAACSEERPAAPTGTDCDDWEWDNETGTYYCDDDDSTHRGGYYHGGRYYSSKKALKASKDYKSYSSSYKSSYKSGIGSGSKGGFGG